MSALRDSFDRKDLEVVAIYIETCGGVDDHAAGVREQVAVHGLDYPVLDGEEGTLEDPTRERFPWAPHALVIDRAGRVIDTYGHMPTIEELTAELKQIVATGRPEPAPDRGWRGFRVGSWAKIRFAPDEAPRTETRTLHRRVHAGTQLTVVTEADVGRKTTATRTVPARPEPATADLRREERPPANIAIDGEARPCRVIRARWTTKTESGVESAFEQTSWIAKEPSLPERLLRRETTKRTPGRPTIAWTTRVRTFDDRRRVGEREFTCWVVDHTVRWNAGNETRSTWYCADVPGHRVRGERRSSTDSATGTASGFELVDFEAK